LLNRLSIISENDKISEFLNKFLEEYKNYCNETQASFFRGCLKGDEGDD
jgi:hypothetical protein